MKSKKINDRYIIKKADIIFVNNTLSKVSKINHSMLSSNNQTKIFTLDSKNKLFFKEILQCNVTSKTTKSGCSKSYLHLNNVNTNFILLSPNYIEIRKLIPKIKIKKVQDFVIKEMLKFVNNPNIKLMNITDISRIFKKCQIPKSELLTKKVNFKEVKNLICHEAVILSWRRGLYKYLKTIYKDENIILEKVNKIIPLDSKKCLLDFSKYLTKTPYWNKVVYN